MVCRADGLTDLGRAAAEALPLTSWSRRWWAARLPSRRACCLGRHSPYYAWVRWVLAENAPRVCSLSLIVEYFPRVAPCSVTRRAKASSLLAQLLRALGAAFAAAGDNQAPSQTATVAVPTVVRRRALARLLGIEASAVKDLSAQVCSNALSIMHSSIYYPKLSICHLCFYRQLGTLCLGSLRQYCYQCFSRPLALTGRATDAIAAVVIYGRRS